MDIVSGTGDVLLGPDWHPVETADGADYRWLADDATAYVPAIERIEHRVSVDIEARHAPDQAQPFGLDISIFDDEDRPVAQAVVRGRQTIQFHLPAGRPKLHAVRFRAGNPGPPAFRVFSIRAEPLRPEVVPLLAGFRIGRGGWYGLEQQGGDVFRWVNNDAEIVVTDAGANVLELDAEPGPALGADALKLGVLARGEELARFVIESRRRITLDVSGSHEVPYPLTLRAENGGTPLPGQPRILNFRVFHIAPN
ncbi:MAG TPA: hypothetical protein VGU66_21640 [Candidatus Elarobacter sp.]|nr:hypothetical protein [Candidatus Elarobacter sp.]